MRTWILTGSPENLAATREHGYPWRFATEPEVVLDAHPDSWIPGDELAPELEHVRKWPAEQWKLAFQGQIRPVSEHDASLLLDRLSATAGTPA